MFVFRRLQGADIPDIEQVVQFGVPSSLSVWTQRSGRAGRSAHINARAILLVEKSMFERTKKRKGKKVPAPEDPDDPAAAVSEDDPEHEWRKKVEDALRKWIETTECRRDVSDKYFNNPAERRRKSLSVYWLLC